MSEWQLDDAQTRLDELIDVAGTDGPQISCQDGAQRAVLLSIGDYNALAQPRDLRAYLLGGPKFDEFDTPRDRDTGRD